MTFNDQPINYKGNYPNALPPGTVLKNTYKVMDVLGQGSYGIIYLAVTQDNQQFAVKEYFHKTMCFRSGLMMDYPHNAEGAENVRDGFQDFSKEASILADITRQNRLEAEQVSSMGSHNLLAEENYNVVRVVENFQANNTSYLVMEFLEGRNLSSSLTSGSWPEASALSIIIPIAWAVQHLHDHHIIHRDINPNNIMISRRSADGTVMQPRLIDFGASKHYDRGGKLTSHSIANPKGTDCYSSCEHTAIEKFLPHVDVFSLGATLFHMLTGNPPLTWLNVRRQSMTMREYLERELGKVNLSDRTKSAIIEAMNDNPNERTQTARGFIENLASPYLPMNFILTSPKGNKYRIVSAVGQEKDFLVYNAERVLDGADNHRGGTAPLKKKPERVESYTIHESFVQGLCGRNTDNQNVTSALGPWPKQDYHNHVKESTGLVTIPSIVSDQQGSLQAELFAANGTIYCVMKKKNGLLSFFPGFKPAGNQRSKKPNQKRDGDSARKPWRWYFVAFIVSALALVLVFGLMNKSKDDSSKASVDQYADTVILEDTQTDNISPMVNSHIERIVETKWNRVRINRMSDGTLRYRSWKTDATEDDKPKLEILGGRYNETDDSYTFVNEGVTYIVGHKEYEHVENSKDLVLQIYLLVMKNGKVISKQKILNDTSSVLPQER